MKKVLFIATSNKTKGGITSVLNTYKQCSFWEKYKVKWIVTHIDKNKLFKIVYFFYGLIQYFLFIGFYDIVHVHVGELLSCKRKYIFCKIAKLLKKKTIIHFHIGTQINTLAKNTICKEMINNATAVIVLSNDTKKNVLNLFQIHEENVHVIYNPCISVKNAAYTDENRMILYAGRLDQNKGYDILLKAFAQIAKKYPDWKIIFAGNGEVSKASQIATDAQITNQVEFKGWVSGTEKEQLFRKATFLCLTSYAEGFPMSILDAWAYGLPVVCTPVGGLKDVLINNENALLFHPGNIEQLSEQLERMMTNDLLREKIAKESHQLSLTAFNLKNIEKQLDALYNSI